VITGSEQANRFTTPFPEVIMAELSRLPGPSAEAYEWQFQGACLAADPTLFFHPDGERGPARARRDAAAVAVCASCPVLRACREHALSVREPYGVWGGLTEDDRESLYRRQRHPRSVSESALAS
jgi:WhiB family redox-sensing transcriptional regulator